MCNQIFSTIGEIKRQQAEISNIDKKYKEEQQRKKDENETASSKSRPR